MESQTTSMGVSQNNGFDSVMIKPKNVNDCSVNPLKQNKVVINSSDLLQNVNKSDRNITSKFDRFLLVM